MEAKRFPEIAAGEDSQESALQMAISRRRTEPPTSAAK